MIEQDHCQLVRAQGGLVNHNQASRERILAMAEANKVKRLSESKIDRLEKRVIAIETAIRALGLLI